jgi:hypothetical protein
MTQRPWHVRKRWRAPALLALAAAAIGQGLVAASANAAPRGSGGGALQPGGPVRSGAPRRVVHPGHRWVTDTVH